MAPKKSSKKKNRAPPHEPTPRAGRADEHALERANIAIQADDVATLREVLEAGLPVDSLVKVKVAGMIQGVPMQGLGVGGDGKTNWTLPYLACHHDSPNCLEALMEAGACEKRGLLLMRDGASAQSPLHACCMNYSHAHRFECMRHLVRGGADPNTDSLGPDGCTILMLACDRPDSTLTRFLLDHGADPNRAKTNGSTALYKAVQEKDIHCCRLLVAAKAHVDAPFHTGATPLMMAAGRGCDEIVRILLHAGADPSLREHMENLNTTEIARKHRQPATANMIEQWQQPAPVGDGPLCMGDDVVVVGTSKEALNGKRGMVNEWDGQSRYRIAMHTGATVGLKAVNLRRPSEDEVEAYGRNARRSPTATAAVRIEELAELVRVHGTPRGPCTWLRDLASRGDVDLSAPVPNGAAANDGLGTTTTLLTTSSMMMWIAPGGKRHAMETIPRALLDGGAYVDGRTSNGCTPLMAACNTGCTEVVKMLLAAGADVNAADESGVTPLMRSISAPRRNPNDPRGPPVATTAASPMGENLVACMKLLLDTGKVNVDQADFANYAALASAVEWGAPVEVIELLLAAGADPNRITGKDRAGFTALAEACGMDNGDRAYCVEPLLRARADTSLEWRQPRQEHGVARTCRQWAMVLNRQNVVDLLDAHDSFDGLCARGASMGAIKPSMIDEMTDAIARGRGISAEAARETEAQFAKTVRELLAEAEEKLEDAQFDKESDVTREWYDRKPWEGDGRDAEPEEGCALTPTAGGVNLASTRGSPQVQGGRVTLQGLKSRPELNGRAARVVSWDADGKRRFGVRLDGGGMLSVKVRNLAALDTTLDGSPMPTDFKLTSAQFCDHLRKEVREVGKTTLIVDWTPLAESMEDLVHLLAMGHADRATHGNRYFYVQRTEASAPFFLAHRELAIHLQFPSGTAFGMADAPAVPWLIFGNGGTAQPPGGPKTCDHNVMGRLAALSICEFRECTVCLQVVSVMNNRSQLPCVHFLCTACIRKMWPPGTRGPLTCPTCRESFHNYGVASEPSLPGGIGFVEYGPNSSFAAGRAAE